MLKQVKIRQTSIGSKHEIAIQSMSNIAASNLEANLKQCRKLYQKGCKLIRFATSQANDIKAIDHLKQELSKEFSDIVLIADTHFSPVLAELAVEVFDKVRINPGNFVDRNTGTKQYTPEEFAIERQKIENQLVPFLQKCKRFNTAIRIGSNHGSLSERIMQKYGDTPQGMVASVEEFLDICETNDFYELIISLKASSASMMIEANRLMIKQMQTRTYSYPLHLGLTEAGNGDEGRIKSALGIGTLLLQGIGDTIRVSLTEAPENEIIPAKKILKYSLKNRKRQKLNLEIPSYKPNFPIDFPIVIAQADEKPNSEADIILRDNFLQINNKEINEKLFDKRIYQISNIPKNNNLWKLIRIRTKELKQSDLQVLKQAEKIILLINVHSDNFYFETLNIVSQLNKSKLSLPLFFIFSSSQKDKEDFIIQMSVQMGALLANHIGNGILLQNANFSEAKLTKWAFMLLQAAGSRRTMPEIIACPSCGRTRFDIEQSVNELKLVLPQLKNVKIAVMGCIINGLGEMADADYGFVGAGKDSISLYYHKKLIYKNINSKEAINKLMILLEQNGDMKINSEY